MNVTLGTVRLAVLAGAVAWASGALAAEAQAVEKPLVVGVRGGMDVVQGAGSSKQPDTGTVEVFVAWSFTDSFSVEASAGYRDSTYTDSAGGRTASFSLTQYPILAGPVWTLLPKAFFSVRLSAGVAFLPTRTAWTESGIGEHGTILETSSTVVGGFAGVASRVAVLENLFADIGFRYVLNPVPSESGRPTTQNYFSAMVAFSSRF
jgi:hypothetical protein